MDFQWENVICNGTQSTETPQFHFQVANPFAECLASLSLRLRLLGSRKAGQGRLLNELPEGSQSPPALSSLLAVSPILPILRQVALSVI